jgi:hypothetical protein
MRGFSRYFRTPRKKLSTTASSSKEWPTTIKKDVQKPFSATLLITRVSIGPGARAPEKATSMEPIKI